MKIQLFSQYYNLALLGKVDFLQCPSIVHKEDIDLFKAQFPLSHKEKNEKIVLQCLACGYSQIAGLQLYENILEKIKRIENEQA